MSEQNAPTPNQRSDASELRRLGRQAIFQVSSNEYWRVVIERAAEELERLQASSEAGAGADDEWEFQIRRALDQLMLRARANPHAGIIELREFCNLELNAVASHVRAAASPASEQEADKLLEKALRQAAEWFEEYAAIHAEKGDEAKKQRNQARADYCRNWAGYYRNWSAVHMTASEQEAGSERVTQLRDALAEALDLAVQGWAYASDYFREKWGIAADLDRLKAIGRGEPAVHMTSEHGTAAEVDREPA